ncbi:MULTISPECIES: Ig-like domain-containing protein [Bacillus]|uniref:Ig-like domain-containing protein n=1 Tax=Bacillus TaxID=1386 RepID=UPI00047A93E9|nr:MULTISPECIES: Ig-like domain-containing protein [Bacillus]QHZ46881.1 hypothetical protein M654_011480 [Bacillus sp. NSP9.1]WFA07011.1 Ig-like domain-containing protein [Bacillus sp. HSf4]
MKLKKSVVSALSISALTLSLTGVASAKEINSSPTEVKNSPISSLQNNNVQFKSTVYIKSGETINIAVPGATRYWTNKQSVAYVDQYGNVRGISRGQAVITIYKGLNVLGAVTVYVDLY